MASDIGVNGNYAPHQGYGSLDQNNAGFASTASNSYPHAAQPTSATTSQATTSSAADIPKDEVGWYFVEQYYTTLSRTPEKLFLFYNKRSQYVSGNETEKVAVSVGQKTINDRIKELDFQDCKVRVTNVDSQASDQNIVIQVIGEISNKSAPHKKFTQTFVLAGQTNGYFVLNDIFRYIVEEEDEVSAEEVQQDTTPALAPGVEEEAAPAAPAETAGTGTLTSSSDPEAVAQDAAKVDEAIEEKVVADEPSTEQAAAPEAPVNGTSNDAEAADADADAAADVEAEAAASGPEPAEETPAAAPETTATETLEAEKPKDPEPTPVMSPAKQQPAKPAAPAAPAAPAKPAAPKTWANLAAAAHRVVTPAVPVAQPAASAAQPKSTAPTTTPAPAAAAPTAGPADPEPSPEASQQDEWTSVGDHKRQQSKAQAAAGAQEAPQYRAYIKNVNDNVDAKDLRVELEKFGELIYFDIARQKNCAFVDFKTAEGYKAAIDANPHQMGSERLVVEERRLKPGSYPYVQRGGIRGGRGGASSQGNGRGSFQGGRGGFSQRGRGGNANRGRGGAQAA